MDCGLLSRDEFKGPYFDEVPHHIKKKKKKREKKEGVFDHNARVSCTREINLEGAHCTPNNFILEGPNMCQHEILLEIAGAI